MKNKTAQEISLGIWTIMSAVKFMENKTAQEISLGIIWAIMSAVRLF